MSRKTTSESAIISARRSLLADLYLSGRCKTLDEVLVVLKEEHGIVSSRPRLSRDLKKLREQWNESAGLTTKEWRERLVQEWISHKEWLLARGKKHPRYSDDFATAQKALAKLTGANSPEKVHVTADGVSAAIWNDAVDVAKLLQGLNDENFDKALSFIKELHSSQAPIVEAEALPLPLPAEVQA